MKDHDTDPSLTREDGEHIAEYLSEFFESFVIVGVDPSGKAVSVIHCPEDEDGKQNLLQAIRWFYKNRIDYDNEG